MRREKCWSISAKKNHLIILNTFFTQHPRRLYTWSSPDQTIRNQIDFILVQKRWRSSFASAKTYPGADCGSDHQLLLATMKFKLRRIKQQRKPVRYDMSKIDDSYRVEVKNRFRVLFEDDPEESTPEELWQEIKSAVEESAKKTTRVASHTKPGHLIELKYVPILKIYRALDKNYSFLIVLFKYLSCCPFKKI